MTCSKCLSNVGNYASQASAEAAELCQNLPRLSISSPVANNISHLTDSDVDLNMPADDNFAYFSAHDFHSNDDVSECFSNSQTFSVINCNIRSLQANYDSLVELLSELYFPFSLIGVTETKSKEGQLPIANTDLNGYFFISQPTFSNAGGVGFYVSNNLHYTLLPAFTKTTNDFETLWIEIQNVDQQNLVCGIIYRHPNGDPTNFFKYLSETVEKINNSNKLCTIMGDFNLDLLQIQSHAETDDFMNILGSSFFQPQILQSTRITDHSATLIDNIFFNSLEHFTISGNLAYDITDHLPNFLIFNKFNTLPGNIKLYKRGYSTLDKQALLDEIQSLDWQMIFGSSCNPDPSLMFQSFYSVVSNIIDRHIPVKQLSRRELKLKSKPWITLGIKKSIQIKNNLYKKFIKTKSTYYHSKFKIYRNKINHLLRISKKAYYNQYFLDHIKDGKKVWNGIKQIIHHKPRTGQKILKLVDNNKEIIDPKQTADTFNTFFANVGKELEKGIPTVNKNPADYLPDPASKTFFILPTTSSEIEDEISGLRSGKAAGPSSIPTEILKLLKSVISKQLEIIFNTSFSTGTVPADFGLANIIPVFKKGSQTCLGNYRPISLLSIFNKPIEKLMYKRLIKFFEKNNMLFHKQFGFRSGYSTDHAILCITDKIQRAIENRNYIVEFSLTLVKPLIR